MTTPKGPDYPYQLLFTSDIRDEPSLPESFRHIYPSDWHLPYVEGQPYIYSNFAISRDGRISFNLPDRAGAEHVTKAVRHDRWLMGLLRMRADAVMVGDGTIRKEPDYLCTAEYIFPDDADAFAAHRRANGRDPRPLLVLLSYTGQVPEGADCLQEPGQQIVMATTSQGVDAARQLTSSGSIDVLELGDEEADLKRLVQILYEEYGVRTLLCEGGANVFGGMLEAGLVHEEFVTWCPTFVGRSTGQYRPSYTEGVAWSPENAPYSEPISLHKAGDYFYLRARFRYPEPVVHQAEIDS